MMQEAWASFAKAGKPSAKGAPQWAAYNDADRNTMIIDLSLIHIYQSLLFGSHYLVTAADYIVYCVFYLSCIEIVNQLLCFLYISEGDHYSIYVIA